MFAGPYVPFGKSLQHSMALFVALSRGKTLFFKAFFWIENPRVDGSIPSLATLSRPLLWCLWWFPWYPAFLLDLDRFAGPWLRRTGFHSLLEVHFVVVR